MSSMPQSYDNLIKGKKRGDFIAPDGVTSGTKLMGGKLHPALEAAFQRSDKVEKLAADTAAAKNTTQQLATSAKQLGQGDTGEAARVETSVTTPEQQAAPEQAAPEQADPNAVTAKKRGAYRQAENANSSIRI